MLKIIIAIVLFSGIILFHELGHFLLARKNGICVEEFSLGIGPTLVGFRRGETKYCIKAIPFGGSCMMLGEDGEEADPRAFNNKSALARFSVVFAGPFFNFILAFILALFVIGFSGADPAVVGEVSPGSGAYEAGLQSGDRIIRLEKSRIFNFREISLFNFMNNSEPDVRVTYRRGDETRTVVVHRKKDQGYYMLGITSPKPLRTGLFGTIKYSILEVRYQIKATFLSLRYLLSGKASINEVSGPVGIVSMIGQTYDQSIIYGIKVALLNMLNFAILLSANLGVMNLLPLPALDGGRLVFIIIEMIRGKRIPPEKEGMIHLAGLVVLLAFMVLVMANDIRQLL